MEECQLDCLKEKATAAKGDEERAAFCAAKKTDRFDLDSSQSDEDEMGGFVAKLEKGDDCQK